MWSPNVAKKICPQCDNPFKKPDSDSDKDDPDAEETTDEVLTNGNIPHESDCARRRTERIKREKPERYNAADYLSTKKKAKLDVEDAPRAPRKRSKAYLEAKKEKEYQQQLEKEDRAIYENVIADPEKFRIITKALEEINAKLARTY